MKIVTAAEMREIDRVTSERFGVPSLTLMESAGAAVAEFVLSRYPQAEHLALVCGKGNNGGDGFVAARKLHEAGKKVSVLLLADPAEVKGDAAEMLKRLPFPVKNVSRGEIPLLADARSEAPGLDLIIDAILGTGFRPPVTGLYADAIKAMNAAAVPIVAVDIPSGADADATTAPTTLVARADAVVTFTAPRPAHVFAPLTHGPIVVAQIGSPEEAIVTQTGLNAITAREVSPVFAPRAPDANKGKFGHVLVVGGSVGKAGAAAMAGMAALRGGSGLVTVATPASVLATVAGFAPEIMTEPLAETDAGTISLRAREYGRFDNIASGKNVLAIGPGVSRNPESAEFVRTVVQNAHAAVVLDADGLNAFEGCAKKLDGKTRPLVLTPHPGEMARLVGSSVADVQGDRLGIARSFAREHNAILVLKGHRTLIAAPDGTVWVNLTGNPGMAKGGSGDVLTGMIAGVLAQHADRVLESVVAAVYMHGLAGDVARNLAGEFTMTATDMISMLPFAFQRLQQRAGEKLTVLSD
ncbi:MAG: NAD(P)H-hydrate dehydratase [Acidobacteria bacterium]|nr:NAD(P)H-hydrate dehydratase [Acidobacteriota bacterium]